MKVILILIALNLMAISSASADGILYQLYFRTVEACETYAQTKPDQQCARTCGSTSAGRYGANCLTDSRPTLVSNEAYCPEEAQLEERTRYLHLHRDRFRSDCNGDNDPDTRTARAADGTPNPLAEALGQSGLLSGAGQGAEAGPAGAERAADGAAAGAAATADPVQPGTPPAATTPPASTTPPAAASTTPPPAAPSAPGSVADTDVPDAPDTDVPDGPTRRVIQPRQEEGISFGSNCSRLSDQDQIKACEDEVRAVREADRRGVASSRSDDPLAEPPQQDPNLSPAERTDDLLASTPTSRIDSAIVDRISGNIIDERCAGLQGEEMSQCRTEHQESAGTEALGRACEGRSPNDMPGGATSIRQQCEELQEAQAFARQRQTEGQVPASFDEAVHNQGLRAYMDPDLPEDKYDNPREGTVRYPDEDEICSGIAPPFSEQQRAKDAPAELTVENIGETCPGVEGGNYFQNGQIIGEGPFCKKARVEECPVLNRAFALCSNAFSPAYRESSFNGIKQPKFAERFCPEQLNTFKHYLISQIRRHFQRQPGAAEAETVVINDTVLEPYALRYLSISNEPRSPDAWEELLTQKTPQSEPLDMGLEEAEGPPDAKNKLLMACQERCKTDVMYTYRPSNFLGEGDVNKLPEEYVAVFKSDLGTTPIETGDVDRMFPTIDYGEEAQGLRNCTVRAYSVRRNVYISKCTALRAMARYGTGDDFTSAVNDQETVSFDGQFRCVRPSIFTVDYDSCKALLNVYNAGIATETVGNQALAVNDMIQANDIQQDAAKGVAEGDQTAALDGMRRSMEHQRNNEIARASFYGINVAALSGAMAAYTTPSSIEDDCASENGVYNGYRCLEAVNRLVNDYPEYQQEFFANKGVLDQFYAVVIQKFGAGLVAGLKAYLYQKQADAVKDVKDSFVKPEFQDQRGFVGIDYCTQNPTAQVCQGAGGGRTRRTGISFSGLQAGGQGGGVVDLSNAEIGEYSDTDQLTASEKAAIRDLSGIINNDNASEFSNDFNAPGAANAQVSRGGGGGAIAGGASASGGGGGGGGGAASAQGGSAGRKGFAQSKMTIGGKGKGFKTFSGSFSKRGKTKAKNAFDNLLGKKGNERGIANIDENQKILPKNIGLFDKISERYVKVNGENRLQKVKRKK